MDKSKFIEMAIGELASIGIINKDDVLDSTQVKVKKAYPAYFGSYNKFDSVKAYLHTIDNLYCIGRNGQHKYNNMDHSMLTAIKAVAVIMGQAAKKDIWQVNTEQEYQEEVKEKR